jgi:disulfide bond formation protein DsbB
MSIKPIYYIFILFISICSIVCAYFVEYILSLAACPLCIYQRFPYLILFMLSIIGLSSDYKLRSFYQIIIFFAIILAGYHTGVENGWFEMAGLCKPLVSFESVKGVDAFKNMLYSGQLGVCNKPVILIMGFSMAEINLVLNIILLFTSFAFKEVKNA